jgi:hypothetical protein
MTPNFVYFCMDELLRLIGREQEWLAGKGLRASTARGPVQRCAIPRVLV